MRLSGRARWALFLLPLVFPWAIVTWETGWYVLFSAFWIDPGPRFVTLVAFLEHSSWGLSSRNFALAWPAGLGLYLLGLLVARALPDHPVLTGSLFWLAGLAVGFYAYGVSSQAGLLALPVGGLLLWIAAGVELDRARTQGSTAVSVLEY